MYILRPFRLLQSTWFSARLLHSLFIKHLWGFKMVCNLLEKSQASLAELKQEDCKFEVSPVEKILTFKKGEGPA